jgi:hypothetical protein
LLSSSSITAEGIETAVADTGSEVSRYFREKQGYIFFGNALDWSLSEFSWLGRGCVRRREAVLAPLFSPAGVEIRTRPCLAMMQQGKSKVR